MTLPQGCGTKVARGETAGLMLLHNVEYVAGNGEQTFW